MNLNPPADPVAVNLAAIGAAEGHDITKRTLAARAASLTFDGTQTALTLLATYRKEYAAL